MMSPRYIVNTLSFSRIVFGMLFVIFFQKRADLLYVSITFCVLASISDLLDGRVARRFGIASIHGRHWDSLGDKAFYVAVIVAFNAHGFLGPLASWGLLFREIALYITRVLYIEKLPRLEEIRRPWTNGHSYFMQATIVLGLYRMYAEINGIPAPIYMYMQATAFAAFAFGMGSIFAFLRLR